MYEYIKESVEYIKDKLKIKPDIALILGSGLGDLADDIVDPVIIKYEDIPHFKKSDILGHKNQLVIGNLSGKNVLVMQGRFHYYEGYSQEEITYPIRVFKDLGISKILITNAAGGCNYEYKPGDLMIISDHINFSGSNPLIGQNLDKYGPRFPDMSQAYSKEGIEIIEKVASDLKIPMKKGVYMFFSGPSYETPAEIKFARLLGADAVGMSTVPEVIVANHCGFQVYGISCITNMAAGILNEPLKHDEVIKTTEKVKEKFSLLVKNLVSKM